ncbi:hypothetical protein [Paenibacillus xylanexedens]|uniref:hypothetical protein n=1 Tax=Paenibacillus xylanexedens TaxID=528191 RepID=UPI001C8E457A|nr:hypothetical protein [Paenibacillus xylanexedens]MBY0117870.1 short-chain dehydrogenase [Paenibacillus xylanexedens]
MTILGILNGGLYVTTKIEENEFSELDNLFNGSSSYDCYCKECERDSIFHKVKTPGPMYKGATPKIVEFSDTITDKTNFRTLIMNCTRNESHLVIFHFWVSKSSPYQIEMKKTGQLPSVADLLSADTKKYRSILDRTDNHELNKAIGLYSHGVGIGSFVYLRRIFENLIEKAHQQAIQNTEWEEEEYNRARMNEKVGMLSNYLPHFLVENRQIYSILSKGIHELTEDECLSAFGAVRLAIELILDEEIAKKESEKKRQQAAQSIASLHQGLK